MSKYLTATLTILTIILMTILTILVGWHSLGMGIDTNVQMKGCLFTGEARVCKMGIVEHTALLQNMITIVLQKGPTLLILLALLAFSIFTTSYFLLVGVFNKNLAALKRLYLLERPYILFDPLKEAFSQGILHPHVYESMAFLSKDFDLLNSLKISYENYVSHPSFNYYRWSIHWWRFSIRPLEA